MGGGLEATYDVHLRLIGKRTVDFLLVLTELFLVGVAAELLRTKIVRKLAHCKRVDHHPPDVHIEERGHRPPMTFARIVKPMNVLQLCCRQFSTKKLCSRLSQAKRNFTQ